MMSQRAPRVATRNMDLVVPLLVAMLLGVPLLLLASATLPPPQRRAIVPVLLYALGLRVALAVIFETVPETRVFHADSYGSEYFAQYIASYWKGQVPPPLTPARNYGYYYVLGAFDFAFGRYRLNSTIFNAIVGSLSVAVLYRIGLSMFHEKVARRAATFSAFFPSMVIWSSIAIKDCLVTFLILLSLLSCIRLRERFSLVSLFGVLLPIFAIYPIRFYLIYFLLAAFAGTMALNRPGKIFAGISKQLLLVGGLAGVILLFGLSSTTTDDLSMFNLNRVSDYRHGMAATAGSGFAQDVDISTTGGALAFLPIGVATMIWAPFPWQMLSLRPLLTLPEMLLWWTLAPALFRGVLFAARKRFAETLPIIVFSSTLLLGYALTMGNVGAAFRMRAQILNLLFLFVAFGHYLRRADRAGIDPELLVR